MNVNIANAARLICSLQAKNVLVLGDVMLDRFVDGAVTRISPEAPVPILSQSRVRQMPGGAANVACNLAQMGMHVHLIGKSRAFCTLKRCAMFLSAACAMPKLSLPARHGADGRGVGTHTNVG